MILALAAALGFAQQACPDPITPDACPVGTTVSYDASCEDEGCLPPYRPTGEMVCEPETALCACGVATWTADRIVCETCTAACGNGVCEPGENVVTCANDCSPPCTPGERRCWGDLLQECGVTGYWDPAPRACVVGTQCRETFLGATCESLGANDVYQLPLYGDADRDGCGAGPGALSSTPIAVYNDNDLDDDDPASGPVCAQPARADAPPFTVPPPWTFDPAEAPSPGPLAGCDASDLSTCCWLGTVDTLSFDDGLCDVTCEWSPDALASSCPCGVDWAASAPDDLVCVPCDTACGDGVCSPGESEDSCFSDCGPVCDEGRTACDGASLVTCVEGQWAQTLDCRGPNPRFSTRTCRETGGVGACVECAEEPSIWYLDADGDGLGDPDVPFAGCHPPIGFVSNDRDLDDTDGPTPNRPPVAIVTPDDAVFECTDAFGTLVPLDASASFDPDGDPLFFQWDPPHLLSGASGPYAEADVQVGGSYTIWAEVTDGEYVSTDSASFSVVDTLPPSITCIDAYSECGDGTLTGAIVEDACAGSIAASPDVDGPYPLGLTTVTWSAHDGSGHGVSCEAEARVVDTLAPELTCVDDVAECKGPVTQVNTSAFADDSCEGALDPVGDDLGPYPLGTQVVTWQASDATGNLGTCEALAEVVDTKAPVLTVLGPERQVRSCSALGTPWVDPGAEAADQCEGELPVDVYDPVDTTVAGGWQVVYEATDSTGNTATETRTVVQHGYTPRAVIDSVGDPIAAGGSLWDAPDPPRAVRLLATFRLLQTCEEAAVAGKDTDDAGLPPVRLLAVHRLLGHSAQPMSLDGLGLEFDAIGPFWTYRLGIWAWPAGRYVATVRTSDGRDWYMAFDVR